MSQQQAFLHDSVSALRVWRVWSFLGLQDIRARFRRSVMGPLWILLNLAMWSLGIALIWGRMFDQPTKVFLPMVTAGLVVWGFITTSFTDGGYSFINAEGYIKQFPYPKQIYLLRSLVSMTMVLFVGLFALAITMLAYGSLLPLGWLLALPGIALVLLAGLGHIAVSSYLTTRFRDFPHAISGILQVLFFITPVMFPASELDAKQVSFVYRFNPLFHLIDVVRHPILNGELASSEAYSFTIGYLALIWLLAYGLARRLDSRVVFLL